MPAEAVLDLVESIGSKPLGEVIEDPYRFPLVVRLPENLRAGKETIASLLIATPAGERIPLARLASVEILEDRPSTITREWGQRRITVTCNVRNRDIGSFVAEAQRKLAAEITMPPGRYHLEFGGQFEHLLSARKRLLLVGALAVMLVFGLLYMTYGNVVDALRVCIGVPFARALAAGHAVLNFRRHRLHRHVGGGRPG